MRPGEHNTITDVPGVRVGHAQRAGDGWLTGTTVVLAPPEGAVGGVDVRGGGPGTRETDLLDPRNLVDRVHAITLTGGSALGLAAVDGVVRGLLDDAVGFPMGGPGEVVPIVPGAVIYDLGRGGTFRNHPDATLGAEAYAAATGDAVPLGVVGAGTGARVGGLKGGVGSASAVLPDGTTVAALVVVNAVGSAVDTETGELWGARHCLPGDLPALRRPDPGEVASAKAAAEALPLPQRAPLATTIGVIATDATLTKAQCQKMSGIGHDGLARALNPVHTMFDGDTLFTTATCAREPRDVFGFQELLTHTDSVVTRSVVRAVVAAESTPGSTPPMRSYREAFASALA